MAGKVLVTGVNGFVGHHLVRELVVQDFLVVGVGREQEVSPEIANLLENYFVCDLTHEADVKKLPLDEITGVINLAGFAAVGGSFDAPDLYMKINTRVLSVMCQEIINRGLNNKIRVLAVSTGAVYAAPQPMPLTENSKVDSKSSPYAASKLAMEDIAEQYRTKGLGCIVVRPLNHIGPGQGQGFLLPDLYNKCLVAIKSGEPLRIGNLTTKRDYTDVRDVAKAYVALLSTKKLEDNLFNVCSGLSRSGEEVLTALKLTLKHPELESVVESTLFRPSDAPDLYGSHELLKRQTGWTPTIPFQQTIADFVASK